jgi:hypothetical protein
VLLFIIRYDVTVWWWSSEMSLGEMKGKKRREEKGSRRGLFKGTFISI